MDGFGCGLRELTLDLSSDVVLRAFDQMIYGFGATKNLLISFPTLVEASLNHKLVIRVRKSNVGAMFSYRFQIELSNGRPLKQV